VPNALGSLEPPAPLLRALTGRDHATLPQLLRARVARTPDSVFLLAGAARWTYAAAWTEILRFATFLRASGIKPGERVASYLTNRPECLWSWFGTLGAGAVYVPLNRNHRGQLLREVAERSQAHMLVTDAAGLAELLAAQVPLDGRRVLLVDTSSADLRPAPEPFPRTSPVFDVEADARPDDLAMLVFTSGTTGRSKAVRLPHNMYCRGADALVQALDLRSNDVFHLWLPLFHIAGQLHATVSTIVAGGAIALFPTFSRSRFWREVAECRATFCAGLPNMLQLLLSAPARPDDALNTLRVVIAAGAGPDLVRDFSHRFDVQPRDTYGMTEVEPLTLPTPAMPACSCGVVGRDFEIAIVDAEDRPLSAAARGHIVMRPRVPGVMMLGYEDDDAATLASSRNLWFHTGDLGYRDEDGFIYLAGREKQMIRRGGENISAFELEALIAQHPAIAAVVVVGVRTQPGDEEVKAVVVARADMTLDPRQIHRYCRDRMARFMVPRFIDIRDRLPCSELGKVQREELARTTAGSWDAQEEGLNAR